MNSLKKEDGIALVLALIMVLIMSVLAVTISFMSNIDSQTMSNYKRGQESFLAAERCVEEGRKRLETTGVESLFFLLQNDISTSDELRIETELPNGSKCRSGRRSFNRASADDPAPFIEIPPPTKAFGRPIKNVSLPSGGAGGAAVVTTTFAVTGKDSGDKDKDDTDPQVNTGTEILSGVESFIPGGASNVY